MNTILRTFSSNAAVGSFTPLLLSNAACSASNCALHFMKDSTVTGVPICRRLILSSSSGSTATAVP